MRRSRFPLPGLLSALILPLAAMGTAAAQTAVPSADEKGADLEWLKRYAGSVILEFKQAEFDEVDFVAGTLKPQEGMDEYNNALRVPESIITLQGGMTRFVYLLPEGRSPLEAVEGYRTELGTDPIFSCKEEQCGGAKGNAVDSGGNQQGLINHVYKRGDIPEKLYSPAWCVLTSRNTGQRYALLKTGAGAPEAHVSVFAAAVSQDSGDCKAFNGRVIAIVTVLEGKAREQNMETVTAEKIGGDIASAGRIALYGVLFDTDKATIKPESEPQLAEIAAFLNANAGTEYLVVGHTDNQGAIDYNIGLSDRRAKSVIEALAARHGVDASRLIGAGVGMASPVAANTDDAGRALNRRVEIVAR
jgi:outer membrane protein OmpA-like peptidoglycan-associated protein